MTRRPGCPHARRGPPRRRRGALVAAALLALAAVGCGRCGGPPVATPSPDAGPRPVATVDGEPIPADAFRRELALARPGAERGDGGSDDAAIRRRLLDDLVVRALLLQQARRRAVVVPPEDVERAVAALRADYTGAQFEALLAEQRLTEPELRARVAEQLALERLLRDEAFAGVAVTDADVAEYYRAHASEFEQPAQVRARQVVVRTREEAERVRAELRRRPDAFAEVARRASIAPEAAAGGDLGWFARGQGMPAVFDACFDLAVKSLSPVIASPYGFHVFEVTGRRPAQRRPLADVRDLLRDRLLRERRARAQEEYVAGLRGRARVVVDEAALAEANP